MPYVSLPAFEMNDGSFYRIIITIKVNSFPEKLIPLFSVSSIYNG